mgnify:FL=1
MFEVELLDMKKVVKLQTCFVNNYDLYLYAVKTTSRTIKFKKIYTFFQTVIQANSYFEEL